jgi:CPA2 family monovalent cation:H+ antiporter-2
MTVMARGEFALILVALAVSARLDERLVPFVGGYVLVLAVLSPLLAAQSRHVAALIPSRLVPVTGPAPTPPEHAEVGPIEVPGTTPTGLGAPEEVG